MYKHKMAGTYGVGIESFSDDASSDSERDFMAPMRLCYRPPQFYCADSPLTAGKTSTAITEMESMLQWFLNAAGVENLALITPFKRIVHLIFVNNSLIEGEQWASRLLSRGIQNMRIFSSKSDIHTASRLYELISEGQYNDTNETYTPIDYVLQCTHGVRLGDYCDDKQSPSGPMPSILKRMAHHHPEVGFVIWSDEIDKLAGLWKLYIPKMLRVGNVVQINGITATAYNKYWDLVHSLGMNDIPLIGSLPDPSGYRTISDHRRVYTNEVGIKSPAKNFAYLVAHPGEVCYRVRDPATGVEMEAERHFIPDLRINSGRIMYVPGEVRTSSHAEIAQLATDSGKNALIINGKFKEFRYADGRDAISVEDYRADKIQRGIMYTDAKGQQTPFDKMAYMDIAVHMYNDPALGLKGVDLVITGFNCITRGITFNRPDFQFDFVILAEYHYKEGDKQIEEIIQAVGRAHGNVQWVRAGICFLAPKYILDMVEQKIKEQIEFLRTAPKMIKYADVFREKKAIPIKVVFHNTEMMKTLATFGHLTEKKRPGFMQLLREGLAAGHLSLLDPNSSVPSQMPFRFEDYIVETKRILEKADKAKSYRFPEFLENYTKRIPYGQAVKQEGSFHIDITLIDLQVSATERIEAGTGFISFVFKRTAVVEAISLVA